MIKFFRRIRQQLLTENRFGKYLLYAIGEILLVIIGILIALNINNQNEQRKERILEEKILIGIEQDFIQTRERLINTISQQQDVLKYSQNLINIIENEETSVSSDSIGLCITRGALSFFRAEPITGTYDALIGAGNTSIIHNQDLLESLADFSSLFNLGFEDESNSNHLMELMDKSISEFSSVLINDTYRDMEGLKYKPNEGEKQNAVQKLITNNSFLYYLIRRIQLEHNRLRRQIDLLAATNNVLNTFESKEMELRNALMQKYVGDYELEIEGNKIRNTISLKDKCLYVQIFGTPRQLISFHTDEFFISEDYQRFKFNLSEGEVISCTLILPDNQEIVWKKITKD